MAKRILIPDTDLSLCPMGMGTLSAGLKWDGEQADRMFGAYLELGGNVVDTARVYQDWVPGEIGRSERVVGQWLKRSGCRDRIVLITKGGHPKCTEPTDDIHVSRMTDADLRHDLELSLRALQTDVIDVYFYHRDNLAQSVEQLVDTMESFVKEGKIRYYACSNWSADRMRQADAYARSIGARGFVADQSLLNVGMKHMKPLKDDTLTCIRGDVADYHRENPRNLAMAYFCAVNGYFQRLLERGEIADEDYDTPGNRETAKVLQAIAARRNTGITQAVLGFLLVQDFPCLALFGPSSEQRVREAMKTLEIPFTREDYAPLL